MDNEKTYFVTEVTGLGSIEGVEETDLVELANKFKKLNEQSEE